MFDFGISSILPPGDFDRHGYLCFRCGCYVEYVHGGDDIISHYPCHTHAWRTRPRSWKKLRESQNR